MDYEYALKFLSMDQLRQAAAVNSIVDMWKYTKCLEEIEDRKFNCRLAQRGAIS